jgi:hypothetical protein
MSSKLRKKTPEELEQSIMNLVTEITILKATLAKVKALPEKWQHDMPDGYGVILLSMREIYFRCIHELDEELK